MSKIYKGSFSEVKKVGWNTYEVDLLVPPEFTFLPGQYVWVILPTLSFPDKKGGRRAFSITSSKEGGGKISILFRNTGSGYKKTLLGLKPNSPLQIRGPFGQAFVVNKGAGDNICFIAGGVGIAPFLSVLRSKDNLSENPQITLINLNSKYEKKFFVSELEEIKNKKGLRLIDHLGPFNRNLLLRVPNSMDCIYFVCGPQEMVDDVYKKLVSFGIKRENIRFEQYYPSVDGQLTREEFETGGLDGVIGVETKDFQKNMFFYFCALVAVFSTVLSLILWSWGIQPTKEYILSFAVVFFWVHVLLIAVFDNYKVLVNEVLIVTIALMGWALFFGQVHGYAPYFLYFFPPLIFFFKEKNNWKFWGATYMVLMISIIIASLLGFAPYRYNALSGIVNIISLIFTAVISYFLASFRVVYQEKLQIAIKLEEKYKVAIESSTNHIIITDANAVILFANKAAQKVTGYSLTEMIGNTPRLWGSQMPPDFYKNMWETKKNKKKPFVGEVTNMRKDGELYTAIARISPILDEAERVIGFVGTEEDVTRLRNAEEGLKVQLNKMKREKVKDEAVLSGIGEGVIVTDHLGKITFANKAFTSLLGWTEKEALGKLMAEVIPRYNENKELIELSKRPITRVLKGQKVETLDTLSRNHFYKRKDGVLMPILGVVTPIIVENKIVGAVQIFRDIAKEKEIDRMKDDFVSIASHELRTPLTAIDGLTSMILDGEYGKVEANLEQPLHDIDISSERLIRLVNDLLNVSRIQAGRLKYTLSEFPVNGSISEVVGLMESSAKKKGIYLKEGEVSVVPVQGDLDKTKQIISNLVGNSIKFTDKGGITVSAKEAGESVEISVTDTGIGIEGSEQAKLFGKFQQLTSTSGRPAGTGLGLFLSREMARKMGGDVFLKESERGKGSTFVFSLPKSNCSAALLAKEGITNEAKAHPDQKSG